MADCLKNAIVYILIICTSLNCFKERYYFIMNTFSFKSIHN